MNKFVEVLYTPGYIQLSIEGCYTPEEPMVMYYSDGSGYPGCPAEFLVDHVWLGDIDIYDLISDEVLEKLEILTLETISDEEI